MWLNIGQAAVLTEVDGAKSGWVDDIKGGLEIQNNLSLAFLFFFVSDILTRQVDVELADSSIIVINLELEDPAAFCKLVTG